MECLEILSSYQWEYIVSLNNHDVIMKTNFEVVQIFKWLNGANDVMINYMNDDRVDLNLDWSFAGLAIFRNNSKNFLPNGISPRLRWSKGYFEAAISRRMVDFMFYELNLRNYMQRLEGKFAIDEVFLPTLVTTDELDVPGAFTHACLDRGFDTTHVTRHSIWSYTTESSGPCLSKEWRHELCIFGIEDLYRLTHMPHIFANKMMQEIDFGALLCWYEYMFNRSYVEGPSWKYLNPNYYLSMPHVRYHNEKLKKGYVDMNRFDCSFTFRDCRAYLNCM